MANLNFDPSKRDYAMLKSLAKRKGLPITQVAKSLLHLAIQNAPEMLSKEARSAIEDAAREVPVEETLEEGG